MHLWRRKSSTTFKNGILSSTKKIEPQRWQGWHQWSRHHQSSWQEAEVMWGQTSCRGRSLVRRWESSWSSWTGGHQRSGWPPLPHSLLSCLTLQIWAQTKIVFHVEPEWTVTFLTSTDENSENGFIPSHGEGSLYFIVTGITIGQANNYIPTQIF